MPLTTTATWPDLVAGRKARASEVEAKFDWLEGSLWPMAAGVGTDNAYDLGTSVYKWRDIYATGSLSVSEVRATNVHATAISPTSTAAVAIGQATPNANTVLDMSAIPRAVYLPVASTTQRDALAGANGMVLYNTTTGACEKYEGGTWKTFGEAIGGTTLSVTFSASATAYTAISLSGTQGKLISVGYRILGTTTASLATSTTQIVVDGHTITGSYLALKGTTINNWYGVNLSYPSPAGGGAAYDTNGPGVAPIGLGFKSSLVVTAGTAVTTCSMFIVYQRN